MKNVLWYLWQLPQHLLALAILGVIRNRKMVIVHEEDGSLLYRVMAIGWGISLGKYIIVDMDSSDMTRDHERGHSRQSKMLGWLYLPVVGIPSITMNILSTVLYLSGNDRMVLGYYKRWPESWADRLGGVKRK